MRTSHVPVLVVGAGPTGALTTLELARRGVHVRTVDKLPRAADSSRAFMMHAFTLELLERIDKRLAARFLDRGVRVEGFVPHLVDSSGQRGDVQPAVELKSLDSRYRFALAHRQSETELYLREYTSAHFGVAPDWGTTCVALAQEADAVTATLESDGVREQVRCHYLVACDGADSAVRQMLGLPAREECAGVLVDDLDAEVEGIPADGHVHLCVGADHRLVAAPLPGDFARLLIVRRPESASSGPLATRDVMAILARHFDGVALGEEVWRAQWRAGPRLAAPAYRIGRVLLAGDAAHAGLSAFGAGLNRGMQDAHNLGWKLAFVVKGIARASLLDTYAAERSMVGAVGTASTLDELFLAGDGGLGALTAASQDGARLRATLESSAGIVPSYGSAPSRGSTLGSAPVVGSRAPDVDLGRGRSLFDCLRHPLNTVLALAAQESGARALEAALKPLAARLAAVAVVRVLGPSAALAARYGASDVDRLLLVRPDGYIAARVAATETAELEAALASWVVA
jgi:2-polyprenyl-6-methoxyphenol hydroxylase-like FAD-dependent oxidoreductase